jgi:hypothetical protein
MRTGQAKGQAKVKPTWGRWAVIDKPDPCLSRPLLLLPDPLPKTDPWPEGTTPRCTTKYTTSYLRGAAPLNQLAAPKILILLFSHLTSPHFTFLTFLSCSFELHRTSPQGSTPLHPSDNSVNSIGDSHHTDCSIGEHNIDRLFFCRGVVSSLVSAAPSEV